LQLVSPAKRPLEWTPNRAERLDFEVAVPTPQIDVRGELAATEVAIRIGAERAADGAGDAFEVRLPIRDDRERVVTSGIFDLAPGAPLALPEPAEAARPGSLARSLTVSTEPAVVRMAAGLDLLLAYPYGCTEQRLASARAQLALARFRETLGLAGGERSLERAVADTMAWLAQVQQPDGLFAFWPGSRGSVALTAWAVELLSEAREGKRAVDEEVERRAHAALEQALRSDYSGFLDGESWAERTWALRALSRAGRFDAGYGNELARRAELLDLENLANVLLAFDRAGQSAAPALAPLEQELWRGMTVRLHQGRETYGGLQERRRARDGRILPSETRTLAEMTRALAPRADPGEEAKRLEILTAALVGLGEGDGWGSTNADSSAILALAELLGRGRAGARSARVELAAGGESAALELDARRLSARWASGAAGPAQARLVAGEGVSARVETSYLPAAPGSQASPRREGFVVAREQSALRGGAAERIAIDAAGKTLELTVGEVVEDHVEVVNPEERHYVAIVVPLAAGMEPLNPALETAPPEAKPAGALTLEPTYVAFLDDQVAFFYDTLPKGTFDFYFRTRAQIPGTFVQPPAKAEMMYDRSVVGTGAGASLVIASPPPTD
jgi:uncharacterized protein YfaS (alpha-2-macroglobulin family)